MKNAAFSKKFSQYILVAPLESSIVCLSYYTPPPPVNQNTKKRLQTDKYNQYIVNFYHILKNLLFSVITIFILFQLSVCTSSPKTPPEWVLNANTVYPRTEFIIGRGKGKTRNEAENRAIAEISRYFLTDVSDEQRTRAVWNTNIDGITHAERQTMEETVVISQVKLMTVRFTDEPWRDKKSGTWETIAYIKRDEGWEAYEPVAKRQSNTLLNIIKTADNETVPFNAYLRYGNALAYANGSEYSGVRAFANVLHQAKADVLFSDADTATDSLVQKQLSAKEKSRVYIEVPIDHNRIIYQATVKALGNAGFTVEQNRNNALTYLNVNVEEGQRKSDTGVFYYPVLTGIISGRSGSLFSFKVEASRQGAINPDIAKQRAYSALADMLEKTFSGELTKYQNTMIRN